MLKGYQMPETLQRLFQIDEQLKAQYGESYEFLGAKLCFGEEGYDCTPDEAIVFLWTGVDGDHFAFLTDGVTVDSLEDAPILFIQPMDFDDPYKPVARNIKEFLALYVQLKEPYLFECLPSYETEEEFVQHYKENFEEGILEHEEEQKTVISAIEQHIQLPEIVGVFAYIQDLKALFQQRLQDLQEKYVLD
ncbi:hypothetical protein GZH47_20680 [Paenibacillus rhizovicinus]|uniref:SMI1/KNR4 family protein n=1 Tax=Paenibacillus rhizovicinus TaxID=2704463 RepID=A0A6C0P3A9_9BACL|nr:hypothetical protein [Paenibacillus rhizovicinus]QHW32969.1 hypothetical protein GZH47_20680 [Paenibacillus rhizovicinus]